MNLEQTELFLAALGSGLSLSLILLIARDFFETRAAKAFILLLVCANTHMYHKLLPVGWHTLSWNIQSMAPAMFWIATRYTFIDPDEPRYISWSIALASFLLPFIWLISGTPAELRPLLIGFPQILEYILVALGFFEILSNWSNDLVEARRKLRGGLLLSMGLATGWSVITYTRGIGDDVMRYIAIDTSLLIMVWFLLQGRAELWSLRPQPIASRNRSDGNSGNPQSQDSISTDLYPLAETQHDSPPPHAHPHNPHLDKLHQLMATGFYREENLTLATLAEELDMPEYKLRATINKSLGYNNFNEYINQLRIGEAADRLVSESETPITNIALDVGYRTMSSFNRAFRKVHNMTPSQYRENDGRPTEPQPASQDS